MITNSKGYQTRKPLSMKFNYQSSSPLSPMRSYLKSQRLASMDKAKKIYSKMRSKSSLIGISSKLTHKMISWVISLTVTTVERWRKRKTSGLHQLGQSQTNTLKLSTRAVKVQERLMLRAHLKSWVLDFQTYQKTPRIVQMVQSHRGIQSYKRFW